MTRSSHNYKQTIGKKNNTQTQENQPQASRFIILIIYYLPQFKTKVRLNNSSIEIISKLKIVAPIYHAYF